MQILFLILMAGLFAVPDLTHLLFSEVYRLERAQIAADNAGIRLGQLDRSVFKELEKTNRLIRNLEKIHHTVHFCSAMDISGNCFRTDKLVEEMMSNLQRIMFFRAKLLWRTNWYSARGEIEKLEEKLCHHSRSAQLPVRLEVCPFCAKKTYFRITDPKYLRTSIQVCANANFPIGAAVEWVGSSATSLPNNYKLGFEGTL